MPTPISTNTIRCPMMLKEGGGDALVQTLDTGEQIISCINAVQEKTSDAVKCTLIKKDEDNPAYDNCPFGGRTYLNYEGKR